MRRNSLNTSPDRKPMGDGMAFTVEQVATALGGQVFGNGSLRLKCAAEPDRAGPDALALATNVKYAEKLALGSARAAILWDGADWRALGLEAAICVSRPRYAMAGLTKLLDRAPLVAPGVHRTSEIDPSADIGPGPAIGPFVVIEARVRIGANARIAANSYIAEDAHIGDDAVILTGVKIGARVHIGDCFMAQPGAVIGADGFSFVTPEKSTVDLARENLGDQLQVRDQSWARIHSLGSVDIGDDVEVGANTTIDRGTFSNTEIGTGTKIDNLVQIGHNVAIGRDCLLCGQSGVAGSTRLGNRVVVGGGASIADHLSVGDDAVIAGKSGVASNVPAGSAVMGYPAMPMKQNIEAYKAFRRLPRIFKQVASLQSSLSKLTKGG